MRRRILFAFLIVIFSFAFLPACATSDVACAGRPGYACLRKQAGRIFNLNKAYAQGLSFSISPPLLEVMIKPGKSVTQTYKILNSGDTVVATLKIVELTEGGLPAQAGIKEDPGFEAESWITSATADLTLKRPFLFQAGEERQLILKIGPPAGIKEEDYCRALVLVTNPNPAEGGSMTSFSQQLAVPLIISVTSTGMVVKGAQIVKFDLPTIVDSFGPLKLNVKVQNTGKTYFRPVGKITLTGPIGKGEYSIVPSVFFTGQTKTLVAENQLQANLPQQTLVLQGLFLGKYQAEVDFSLDDGTIRVGQKKIFYALPWKAGLVMLILIALTAFWVKKRK